jgi:hypothetical protein
MCVWFFECSSVNDIVAQTTRCPALLLQGKKNLSDMDTLTIVWREWEKLNKYSLS